MVFLEAVRQLMKRVGRENAVLCHVSLVPVIGVVGYVVCFSLIMIIMIMIMIMNI